LRIVVNLPVGNGRRKSWVVLQVVPEVWRWHNERSWWQADGETWRRSTQRLPE